MRFNCRNGHNFYMSESLISQANLEDVQSEFKTYQKQMKKAQLDILSNKNANLTLDGLSHQNRYIWCSKCSEYYNHCSYIANQSGLKIIGGLYCDSIILCCMKNMHLFSIGYNRKLT